jgi:hypothetical protein
MLNEIVSRVTKLGALASDTDQVAGLTTHAEYSADLKRARGRKAGFWSLVKDGA